MPMHCSERSAPLSHERFYQCVGWQEATQVKPFREETHVAVNARGSTRDKDVPATQQAQDTAAPFNEHWRQQLDEALESAVNSIQQQVVDVAVAQLEPLRERMQEQVTRIQEPQEQPEQQTQQEQPEPHEQQEQPEPQPAQGTQPPDPKPTAVAPTQPAHVSAPDRRGATLSDTVIIALAIAEILDGIAILLIAMHERSSTQHEPSSQESQGDDGEPPFQKLGHAITTIASSLRQTASHGTHDGASLAKSAERLEGPLASAPKWGDVLKHASALIHTLQEGSSDTLSGTPAVERWEPAVKQGAALVKELSQAVGLFSSSKQGSAQDQGEGGPHIGETLGRASSMLKGIGKGSSSEQGDGDSSEKDSGDDSEKEDDDDSSSPLEKLVGKDSPLKGLREFSKRQDGPGGLAPQGPIRRKPPAGPLRRDRFQDAK